MRQAARVDKNQKVIVNKLREKGATVQHLHAIGKGCPDLLVGIKGQNLLIEVKDAKGILTEHQERWHDTWNGKVFIVRDEKDIDILLYEIESD